MEIRKRIDNSKTRIQAEKEHIPIVEMLLKKISIISKKEKRGHTLLAVCPNSQNVLKAALRAAKRANAPIKFAATLNQVDTDGGYTGWVQNDLVRIIKEESYKIGYNGTIIIAVDHGGPWLKDMHTINKFSYKKAMNWIKRSFEASISAGYDLIHIDPTVDIYNNKLEINTVVNRTVELICHCEKYRNMKNIFPISYEVGTEEVHGGLADLDTFKNFLKLMERQLKKQSLDYLWPIFIVAKVGTDLHTTIFNPATARNVVNIVKNHNSYIKGHYTDFVSNPEDYPKSGMGAANVGPEFTIAEYDALNELIDIEKKLYQHNKIACLSKLREKLTDKVLESGRWKKWLLEKEKDFLTLSNVRKDWILKTSCRYIWAEPEIKCSINMLYNNLQLNGIDAENWVLLKIETAIDRYFEAFNLIDINKKIERR